MSLRPGEVFAGYTIERELGAGGMGAVYLARHPRLPRFDALKLLRPELCDDPAYVGRFEREADTVAQLDHPNIVAVYDRGSADGQLWISMRFIDGTNAEKALDEYPVGMPAERAVRIVSRVASALDYAHRHDLLHRDVKPANILLAAGPDDDESERVFLSDFGVAKAIGAAADRIASLTSVGSVVATLDYASPEQIKGQRLDHRSDVYALGCVLYKLLTGRVPFPGDSIATRVYGHLNVQAPPPTGLVADLPATFDTVVATAMAKEADDRYPTCRALARAAQAALSDPAVPPTPPAPAVNPDPDPGTTVNHRPTGLPPPTGGAAAGSSSEPVPARQPDAAGTTPPTGGAAAASGRWTAEQSETPGRWAAEQSEASGRWTADPAGATDRSAVSSGPATRPESPSRPTAEPRPEAVVPHRTAGGALPPRGAGDRSLPSATSPGGSAPTGRSSRRPFWIAGAVAAVVLAGAVTVGLLVRGDVGGTAAPSTGSATVTSGTAESSPPRSSGITDVPSPTPVAGTASGPVPDLPHAAPLPTSVVLLPQIVNGTGDLYAVDADTIGTVAQLTTGAGGPQAPVLSPDRGSVVYVQSSAISGTVRTVAVDGTGDRPLWDGRPADCQTFFRPAWDPIDQTRLAVPCVTTSGSFVLSVIGTDRAGTVYATIDTGLASVTDVGYSPDGTTLVYQGTDRLGATTSAIYTQPADGSTAPTRVTDGTVADSGPMFSPDGARIVYTRTTPGTPGSTIVLMNADGTDALPLTDGVAHDQDPAWSPDGTRIAFRSDRSTGDPNVTQFWVMQGNGADPQPLNSEVANGPAAWGRR